MGTIRVGEVGRRLFGEPRVDPGGPGVHVARGFDLGNVVRIDTREGPVVVDTASARTSAAAARDALDLCLHLVRRDLGAEEANRLARACVVPPHREGGQAQYVERPIPASEASTTALVTEWMLRHLDAPIRLADLAERAAVSVRTLNRRFREEVGTSPMRWLAQQRVAEACRLLETTALPVEEVARRVGLGTAAALRLHMAEAVGVSPTAYRRTFAAARQPVASTTMVGSAQRRSRKGSPTAV